MKELQFYSSPEIETIEVKVEQGFAASDFGKGNQWGDTL